MKLVVIMFAIALLLSACGKQAAIPTESQAPSTKQLQAETQAERTLPHSPEPVPEPSSGIYEFHDEAVKECVERYFSKSADELTEEDFETLSALRAFSFDAYGQQVKELSDLPALFPELRYVSLAYSWFNEAQLSEGDCVTLGNMESLRAVDIYSDGLPSLGFAKDLPYVSLRYTEKTSLSEANNLAEASVLGRGFIESHIAGRPREYVRVADGEHVFELFVSECCSGPDDAYDEFYETKLFVSEKRDNGYRCSSSFVVPGRYNASGGLILTDVNFDGQKDILVLLGCFGNQAAAKYACYLCDGGTYRICESFSDILNPSVDVQNKRVLSTYRISADVHGWSMFSWAGDELLESDRLTQEPEETGEWIEGNYGVEIFVWKHEVDHFSGGNTRSEVYLTCDYTDDEWIDIFYDDNSFWGLFSEKWRTLHNNGMLLDWSLYGDGPDAQIMQMISN